MRPTQTDLVTREIANQVLFHYGHGGYPAGGFISKLLTAWGSADPSNSARLASVFPDYGAALALVNEPGGMDLLRQIAGRP